MKMFLVLVEYYMTKIANIPRIGDDLNRIWIYFERLSLLHVSIFNVDLRKVVNLHETNNYHLWPNQLLPAKTSHCFRI